MCFSAPASFIAAAGLAIVGAATLKQAKTRPQYMLAATPLIFSIQQLSEGFLWLSLSNPEYEHLQNLSMYTFLAFAQVLWPAYVPFTILAFERPGKRRKVIGLLAALGTLTAGYLLFCLLRYPVSATIGGHHINYQLDFPEPKAWISGAAYSLATVAAPLLSRNRGLIYLGLLLLVSYLATMILFSEYFISVWCYFAAILSVYVWFFIRREKVGN